MAKTATNYSLNKITNLTQNTSTSEISYVNEAGALQTAQVVSEDIDNAINVGSDGGAILNPLENTYNNHYIFGRIKNPAEQFGYVWNVTDVYFPDVKAIHIVDDSQGSQFIDLPNTSYSSIAVMMNTIIGYFQTSGFLSQCNLIYHNIGGQHYIQIVNYGGPSDISQIRLTIWNTGNNTTNPFDAYPERHTLEYNYQQYQEVEQFLLPDKVYSLPAPVWESRLKDQPVILSDGSEVLGDEYFARVPLVDQELINKGILYVEYGRLRNPGQGNRGYKSDRPRGSKISFYSQRSVSSGGVNGRGYSAGGHTNAQSDRQNLFPVIHQGFDAPLLPRNAFYRMYSANFYNGTNDGVTYPFFQYPVPHMTGGKIRKVAKNIFMDGQNNGRRVREGQLRDKTHRSSKWYARLVIIKDGRVIQQGPISEGLNIDWEVPVHRDEFERKYSMSNISNPYRAKITIDSKYKK